MNKKFKLLSSFVAVLAVMGIISACNFTSDESGNSADSSGSTIVDSSTPETNYTVTFKADGVVVGTDTYTEEDKSITEPAVPAKDHYTGAWEAYTLDGGDVTVNAVYTAVEYTVTFKADGETVGTATYTVENKEIAEPAVPTKDYYKGAWETYVLESGNVTINAEYVPIEDTMTFMNGEGVGETV